MLTSAEAGLRPQLVPPEVKDTPEAPKQAREALQRMGPMSRDQIIMSATMAGAVVLWVLGDQLRIPAVTAAMLGLCSLLLTGVLKWRDCLEYSAVRSPSCSRPHLMGSVSGRGMRCCALATLRIRIEPVSPSRRGGACADDPAPHAHCCDGTQHCSREVTPMWCMQAWDTLFWFAVLVGMSGQLNSSGVIKYFADVVGGKLTAMNLGWQPVFGLLNLAYFGLHYMFASQTAHVGALYAAFLAMMLSAGELTLPAACDSSTSFASVCLGLSQDTHHCLVFACCGDCKSQQDAEPDMISAALPEVVDLAFDGFRVLRCALPMNAAAMCACMRRRPWGTGGAQPGVCEQPVWQHHSLRQRPGSSVLWRRLRDAAGSLQYRWRHGSRQHPDLGRGRQHLVEDVRVLLMPYMLRILSPERKQRRA